MSDNSYLHCFHGIRKDSYHILTQLGFKKNWTESDEEDIFSIFEGDSKAFLKG